MKAQVKLARKVEIGDMGSIVFPASDVFISWILDMEAKHHGVWRHRNIVGQLYATHGSQLTRVFTYKYFQNLAVALVWLVSLLLLVELMLHSGRAGHFNQSLKKPI